MSWEVSGPRKNSSREFSLLFFQSIFGFQQNISITKICRFGFCLSGIALWIGCARHRHRENGSRILLHGSTSVVDEEQLREPGLSEGSLSRGCQTGGSSLVQGPKSITNVFQKYNSSEQAERPLLNCYAFGICGFDDWGNSSAVCSRSPGFCFSLLLCSFLCCFPVLHWMAVSTP